MTRIYFRQTSNEITIMSDKASKESIHVEIHRATGRLDIGTELMCSRIAEFREMQKYLLNGRLAEGERLPVQLLFHCGKTKG